MKPKLQIDWIKDQHTNIDYFGLGFIQVKLGPYYRMHFYTTQYPMIVPEESIHNHRYDFTSHILKGYLNQKIYHWYKDNAGEYIMRPESCKEGQKVEKPVDWAVSIKLALEHQILCGTKYFIQHEVLHRVNSTFCITFLERGEIQKDHAYVVDHKDTKPVCPFSKKISQNELWAHIAFMLKE